VRLEDVQYLTVRDVLDIHIEVLVHGEDPGVLKPYELDAAVMAVQATFAGAPLLASLAEVAAAYVFYLNRSHVFLDGNKRTSIVSAFMFLEANGFRVDLSATDWLAIVVGVVRHETSQHELSAVFARAIGIAEPIEW